MRLAITGSAWRDHFESIRPIVDRAQSCLFTKSTEVYTSVCLVDKRPPRCLIRPLRWQRARSSGNLVRAIGPVLVGISSQDSLVHDNKLTYKAISSHASSILRMGRRLVLPKLGRSSGLPIAQSEISAFGACQDKRANLQACAVADSRLGNLHHGGL